MEEVVDYRFQQRGRRCVLYPILRVVDDEQPAGRKACDQPRYLCFETGEGIVSGDAAHLATYDLHGAPLQHRQTEYRVIWAVFPDRCRRGHEEGNIVVQPSRTTIGQSVQIEISAKDGGMGEIGPEGYNLFPARTSERKKPAGEIRAKLRLNGKEQEGIAIDACLARILMDPRIMTQTRQQL